jgi:TolA-binding protein
MKHLTRALGAMMLSAVGVLMLFSVAVVAQEQSDYAIVKSYETKYKAIKDAIKQVQTVQQCAEVSANIDDLENEFAADTALLNKSLYPDKYDDQITEVRVELRLNQDKLGIIESSVARIADLEKQVRSLSGKVDSLSAANDKLMASLDVMSKAVEKNTKTIDSLNHLVADLRRSIRARDEAIFAMTDSLFMQYDKNIQGLPDQEKKMLVGKVERHNVVSNIMDAAKQNIKFLETTQLSSNDLVGMVKEQRQFSSYWNGLGPKLAAVYISSNDRAKQIAAIDTVVAQWGRKADSSLWAGLNAEFASKQIPVQPFHSGDEFVANLSKYFDDQTNDSKSSSAEKESRLNHFLNDVWNPSINSQWLPTLVDAGIITRDQQSQLQTKLSTWEAATKPSHTLLYAVIFLVILAVVVFFVIRNRKKPQPSEPSPQA